MFGVLPIDKPAGLTSRGVCNQIERFVRPEKVGHTGTLDPLATGVLLLAIGRAARLVEFSHGHSKEYRADFQLGLRSPTLDVDSEVEPIETLHIPTRADLEREVAKWLGSVKQVPPKYSAINLGGRRAYDLARKGRAFELAPREIEIHSIEILGYEYPYMSLRIDCGTGTYVRSLGSDIARGVGSDAVMCRLVRTRIGPVGLNDCVPLQAAGTPEQVMSALLPPQILIANIRQIRLDADQCAQIRHGIPLQLAGQTADKLVGLDAQDRLVTVMASCESAGRYRSLRVFHETTATSQPSATSNPLSPES
jgi:tRNA pseudouridine55 synthase